MFQFRRFPTVPYLIQARLTWYCHAGVPHSEISGSMRICRSPKLIAACRVLQRLPVPRHSPCALFCLTSSRQTSYPSLPRKRESSSIPLPLLFHRKPASLGFAMVSVANHGLYHIAVLRIMQASTEVFTNRSDYPFVIPQLLACLRRSRAAPSVALLHFLHHNSLFSFQGAGRRHLCAL